MASIYGTSSKAPSLDDTASADDVHGDLGIETLGYAPTPSGVTGTIHKTILAVMFTLAFAGSAPADELQPVAGRSIDLGPVSGVAYYTIERDGFRVVATLAEGETGTPVRFEAILAPDQSLMLSTPHGVGVASTAIEISRQDDQVVIYETAAATN